MIRLSDTNELVLTPRAFSKESGHDITIPLERCYVCPSCSGIFYGVFKTTKGEDNTLNLNPYAVGNENTTGRPNYHTKFVELPNGERFQIFMDLNHCGPSELKEPADGKLLKLANLVNGMPRCKFVKFYFEPASDRLLNRFLKDLREIELYGGYVNGTYYSDQGEYLNAVIETLGVSPEKRQLFLANHPYGRFVPDITGKGPAGYLAMYRFEHAVVKQYYTSIIQGTNERIH